MNLLDPIEKIMTKDLVTLGPHDNMIKVKKIFTEHTIHHIPIVDNSRLVGMISKSDYLFFVRDHAKNQDSEALEMLRLKTQTIDKVMTKGLATLEPSSRINVALEIFNENLFHAIPIVEDEKLVGLVSTFDIINHLSKDRNAINQY